MPLSGKSSFKQHGHKQVIFFLDECLPHGLADVLKTVGYPIISWYEEFKGQQGTKDPWLIPYLGAKGYTWVTKDHETRRKHESEIRASGISVVWIRGLERAGSKPKKNEISIKDLHRMLTDKLDAIEEQIASAKGPRYFLLYMKSGRQPVVKGISL